LFDIHNFLLFITGSVKNYPGPPPQVEVLNQNKETEAFVFGNKDQNNWNETDINLL